MLNKYRHRAGQYGNRDKLALAQEGTDALAPQIREQGFGVIDSIASAMLSAFPKDACHLPLADTPEMTSLLSLLHLDKKVKTLGFHFTDELSTPVTFIREIARLSKMNPILVTAAVMFHEQMNSMQSFLAPGIKRDADVRMAVVYCYLLHCITKIVIDEPIKTDLPEHESTFTQKLYEHFEELRKTSRWVEYFSTFENAKLVSVSMVFKHYALRYKTRIGFGPEKHLRGLALSINILEAMMQDIKLGYTDNAWCGFELMLEPGNRMLKGTGSTADYIWMRQDGRPSGVICVRCPLPIIWNNLYMAWNLGFVADQYSDWPMFFAKLLNPAVVGMYNEIDPGKSGRIHKELIEWIFFILH